MANWATGKYALGICDVCGFRYPFHELKYVSVRRKRTGIKACPDCYDEDHPQNFVSDLRPDDPRPVREPRPESVELDDAVPVYVAVSAPYYTGGYPAIPTYTPPADVYPPAPPVTDALDFSVVSNSQYILAVS